MSRLKLKADWIWHTPEELLNNSILCLFSHSCYAFSALSLILFFLCVCSMMAAISPLHEQTSSPFSLMLLFELSLSIHQNDRSVILLSTPAVTLADLNSNMLKWVLDEDSLFYCLYRIHCSKRVTLRRKKKLISCAWRILGKSQWPIHIRKRYLSE